MQNLLSSPAMIAFLGTVLVLEAVSLLVLLLFVQLFRRQAERYRILCAHMGNIGAYGNPGRILLPCYILITLAATIATIALLLFQPHIL